MMGKPQRHGDIDIEKNHSLQFFEWRVQRLALVFFSLILIAAFLGAFGSGPLSNAHAFADGGLNIEYKRTTRWTAHTPLKVAVQRTSDLQDSLQIWIDRAFLEANEIELINPEPTRSIWQDDRVVFEFPLGQGADHGSVIFSMRPQTLGNHTFSVGGGNDADGVALKQFVFP